MVQHFGLVDGKRFNKTKKLFAVFSARREDFENIMRKQNIVQHDTVVKLRGLPWRVTVEEIVKFFDGMSLFLPVYLIDLDQLQCTNCFFCFESINYGINGNVSNNGSVVEKRKLFLLKTMWIV